jgi:hypothetical protein
LVIWSFEWWTACPTEARRPSAIHCLSWHQPCCRGLFGINDRCGMAAITAATTASITEATIASIIASIIAATTAATADVLAAPLICDV